MYSKFKREKNIMNIKTKKIIGALFAVVVLSTPAVSFAAILNSDPKDFDTLRVFNYTISPSCTTCWSRATSAEAGDLINFAIYYHNTGTDTAQNVRVKLTPQNTTRGTTHTFLATVSADNALTVSGTVVVVTPSNQILSFMTNGVLWRPNQTVFGSSPLPFGQTATDIFSGNGINIGNVAPGWSKQGSVIVRFQVSSAGNPVPSVTVPFVSTNSASSVSQNGATLNGNVTPNGGNTNAWFEWGATQSLGNTTSSVNYGNNPSSFSSGIFNLHPNSTYYFRAVAQNSFGTVYGSILSFNTSNFVNNNPVYSQPFVSTNSASGVSQNSATLNGYVSPNGSNTNAWFEWGTNTNFGNTTPLQNYGTNASSLSNTLYNLNSNTTYYYRAVAQGQYGNVYGGTISFTTTGTTQIFNNTLGNAPTATTLLATEVTETSAKLNGLIFASNNQPSSAWFEWGANTSLGNRTQAFNVGSLPVIRHADSITGLVPEQTYYYRVVAENTYGKVFGTINTFVAEEEVIVQPVVRTVVRPVVRRVVNTVVRNTPAVTEVTNILQTQSPMSLTIEGGAEMIGNGEKRTYRVAWKNESSQILRNTVLRVVFPKSMNIDSATSGVFSKEDNSVLVDIKTLAPGDSGDTFIFATAGHGMKAGETLVVTAYIVFTVDKGVQGDAIAYVVHKTENTQTNLGASVLTAGEFIPTTLFEWILLMILVLVLVLLGNHLYGRISGEKH